MTPQPRNCPGICTNLPELLLDIKEGIVALQVETREIRKLCPDHADRIRIIEDQILQARTAIRIGKGLWLIVGVGLGYALPYLPALLAQAQTWGGK